MPQGAWGTGRGCRGEGTRGFSMREESGEERRGQRGCGDGGSVSNDLYASTVLVQMYNQSITYIRSSSNVFGFMKLSPPTKVVCCSYLLGDQVHKSRYIGSKSNACD
jgi:hypothetical protein